MPKKDNYDTTSQTLSTMLITQLMAAEVYAHFLRVSSQGERELWSTMLDHELAHVAELRELLHSNTPINIELPDINLSRMHEIRNQIIESGNELFMMRLEGALRLETAELDYGLEGMAVRRMHRKHPLQNDIPAIRNHIDMLLKAASRYSGARNIELLIRRLRDLSEASTADTEYRHRPPLD